MVDHVINTLKNLKKDSEITGGRSVTLASADIAYLLSFVENMKKEMEQEKEKAYRSNIQSAASETKIAILEKEVEELRKTNRQACECYNAAMAKLKAFSAELEKSQNENERLKADIRSSNHIDRNYAIRQIDSLIRRSARSTDSWFYERFKDFLLILPSTKDLKETVRCTNCEHYHPIGNEIRCMYKDLCCPQNPEGAISRSVRWCYACQRGKEKQQ